MDRNFDELAERFERRVYGGLKGDVRLSVLWRDLLPIVQRLEEQGQPLNILDIGGGLAQISIALAERGHRILYNDVSGAMLEKARLAVSEAGVSQQFIWQQCGYLELLDFDEKYDLVLCHALLEWLEQPQQVFSFVARKLESYGFLSLCFYNPAAKIYRNLIRGNFDWLENQDNYRSNTGSLTQNNPCELAQVRSWLHDQDFNIFSESGIRVFHDYVVEQRGGHGSPEAVLAMELAYSDKEPFKWLGRYLHILSSAAV